MKTISLEAYIRERNEKGLPIPDTLRGKYLSSEDMLEALEECRLPADGKIDKPVIGIGGICYRPAIIVVAGAGKVGKSLFVENSLALNFKSGGTLWDI